MPSKRRHAGIGFATVAALAVCGLFVLDGPVAGAVLLAALVGFIGAGVYALKGQDPDAVTHAERTGLSGWVGGWF